MNYKLFLKKAQAYWTLIYFWVMLGFFPIYYKYQYDGMGDAKYEIFKNATLIYVVGGLLLFFIHRLMGEKKCIVTKLDKAVAVYFLVVAEAYLLSPYKEKAFVGAAGWNMGFLTVLLMIVSYFLISSGDGKQYKNKHVLTIGLGLILISSVVVYIVAILHRFDVDLFHIYGDVDPKYKVWFLSTIGQSSWYSSFLCTVWPLGVYLFYIEEKAKRRMLYGGYLCLGAMSLVTQNTDTAYLSLGIVIILLFLMCQNDTNGVKRFLETLILILGSFKLIGIFQTIFDERMIPIEQISIQMSKGSMTTLLFVGFVLLYVFLYIKTRTRRVVADKVQKLLESKITARLVVGVLLLSAVAVVLLIILNTKGWLYEVFGIRLTHNYLFFDDLWGNMRGFSWRMSWNCFQELPLIRKIIGVGPDCFSAYYQSMPLYNDQIEAFFGGQTLTNAHNEYLTKLINVGILGLCSYLSVMFVAICQFEKKRHKTPILGAFILVIGSYMAHNIFCYEQVCCTPIFFILIAIGNKFSYNDILE